jgi:hypothetical protein
MEGDLAITTGQDWILQLETGMDLNGASSVEIKALKPSSSPPTQVSFPADIVGPRNTIISAAISVADNNAPGEWVFQGWCTNAAGKRLATKAVNIRIYGPFEYQ